MGLVTRVKEALGPIQDIARSHMTLTGNAGILKGLCPFHSEKTPSFVIYIEDQHYKCFGCDAYGDALDLVAHFRGRVVDISFLVELAEELGLEHIADKYAKQRKVLNEVADYWHTALFENDMAKRYLAERGIKPSTAKAFKLGFATGDLHQQMPSDELYDLGLIRKGNHGDYDFFRDRLMIPITVNNQVRGFGGRTLVQDNRKYINSLAHPLFNKRTILLGLDKAKMTDHTLVLVEGYFDVIALHQAGYTNTVGLMGTALTKDHLNALSGRNIERIVLAFDSDPAGIKATWVNARVIAQYMPTVHIAAILAPVGHPLYGLDPDEMINNDAGMWEHLVDNAHPVWQVYVDYLVKFFPRMKSEGKQKALYKMLDFLNSLNAFMANEGKAYLAECSGIPLSIINSLEDTKPKLPPIVTSTLKTVERYPQAVESVNQRLQKVGLSPIGELDFGKYWNQRNDFTAGAGNLEDLETSIFRNIIDIRKVRLPKLMNAGRTDLQTEWAKLLSL